MISISLANSGVVLLIAVVLSACNQEKASVCDDAVSPQVLSEINRLIYSFQEEEFGAVPAEGYFSAYELKSKRQCGDLVYLTYGPKSELIDGYAVLGTTDEYTVNLATGDFEVRYLD